MGRVRFLSAGRTLSLGFAAQNVLVLVRAMLVARLLGPEYFGISITFLLVVSTFALMTDLGIEKWLIQTREEEVEATLPTLATVLLARGVLIGVAILMLSGWIARQFGNPDLAWFYALAAIVPAVEGFRHLDQVVQQRRMNFVPKLKMELGGLVPGVILTIILAFETRSFLAVGIGAVVASTISVVLSHVVARTPYRLGFDRLAIGRILIFGWPLLLSGMVIFLSTQGDRIVIGALAGMTDLAGYAAVATVTAGASTFFAHLCGGLFLPLMSEVRERPEAYEERSRTTAASVFLIVSLTLVPLASIGAPLVEFLYGPDYRTDPLLPAFLSLLAASTVIRVWCVVMTLSVGRTGDVLISNVLRASGLAGALIALSADMGLVEVAACMCAGDLFATLFFLWRIKRNVPGAQGAAVMLVFALTATSAMLIAVSLVLDPYADLVGTLLVSAVTCVPGALAALLFSRDLRGRIAALYSSGLRKLVRGRAV